MATPNPDASARSEGVGEDGATASSPEHLARPPREDQTFVRTTVPSRQATQVDGLDGRAGSEGPGVPTRFEPGARVGRYHVLHRVGSGGMGVVYAAYDPELDRRVAIKILHVESRGGRQARLIREAQAMARLAHPNVVAVHDVGTVDDAVFVAMEFVEGGTLADWMHAANERSRAEILETFRQAGRGLAAAHAAGLVHRDFKPDNVLIDVSGRPRVTDFGLARATEGVGAVERSAAGAGAAGIAGAALDSMLGANLTQTGAVLGTPAYMSPEQFRGELAGPASDQFSFCIALYEALYGERPFPSSTPAELALAVLGGEMRGPPSGATVPAWIRRVVVRGLGRTPDERFASMDELLVALDADPGARRRGRLAWALGLGGAAAIAGSVWWGATRGDAGASVCDGGAAEIAEVWNPERRRGLDEHLAPDGGAFATETVERLQVALDEHVGEWSAQHRDACEATHVRAEQSGELLDLRMACLDRGRRELDALVNGLEHAGPAVLERVPKIIGDLPDFAACADGGHLRSVVPAPTDEQSRTILERVEVLLARSLAATQTGNYDEALALARETIEVAEPLEHAPTRARVRHALGSALWLGDEPKPSVPEFEAAFADAIAGRDDRLAAKIATELVHVVGGALDQAEPATTWAGIAAGVLRRRGIDPERDAHLANSRGILAERAGRYAEALTLYRASADARAAEFGRDDIGVANALNNIAMVYEIQNKVDEALEVHAEAIAIRRRVSGPRHPDVADSLNNAALVHRGMGNAEKAREGFEKAIEIWSEAMGPESLSVASGLNNLGALIEGLGERERALEHYERALAIRERLLPPNHTLIASVLKNMGHVLPYLDRPDEARTVLERALKIQHENLGQDHPYGAETMMFIGNLDRDAERWDDAIAWYERAAGILEASFPDGHGITAQALLFWGRGLRGRDGEGDRAAARAKIDAAHAMASKVLGERHALSGNALDDLAELDLAAGQNERAAERFAFVLELRQEAAASTPGSIADAAFGLARARWRSGGRDGIEELVALARSKFDEAERPGDVATLEAWNAARR